MLNTFVVAQNNKNILFFNFVKFVVNCQNYCVKLTKCQKYDLKLEIQKASIWMQ